MMSGTKTVDAKDAHTRGRLALLKGLGATAPELPLRELRLQRLVGRQITELVRCKVAGDICYGFKLDTNDTVWIWKDAEGNGPGHLDIVESAKIPGDVVITDLATRELAWVTAVANGSLQAELLSDGKMVTVVDADRAIRYRPGWVTGRRAG
jgi:hypothetical protein